MVVREFGLCGAQRRNTLPFLFHPWGAWMTTWNLRLCWLSLAVLIANAGASASAAELKIISSNGMRGLLEKLQPQLEQATQHTLTMTFGTAAPLKRQIDEGAAFDVAVLTPQMLAELAKGGRVAADSVLNVAKSGLGLAARSDTRIPQVSSATGLKRMLLDTRLVAYSREGQSGLAAANVLESLGIAQQLKSRIVLESRPGGALSALHEGNADLAFALVSEILPEPGAQLVGTMPPDLQSYVVFAAAASATASDPAAARRFLDLLRGPEVRSKLAQNGLEAP
jgi:molybdate transport system substrate-binding protein